MHNEGLRNKVADSSYRKMTNDFALREIGDDRCLMR